MEKNDQNIAKISSELRRILLSPELLKKKNKEFSKFIELKKQKLDLISDHKNYFILKCFSKFMMVEKKTLKIKEKIPSSEHDSKINRIIPLNDHIRHLYDLEPREKAQGRHTKISRFLIFEKFSTYEEEMSYCERNPNRRLLTIDCYFDKRKSILVLKRPDIGVFSESLRQRRVIICFKSRKILGRLPLININNRINLTIYQFFFKLFNLIENHEDQLFHDGDYKKHKVRAFEGNFFNFGNHDKKWFNRIQGVISNNIRLSNLEKLQYFNLEKQKDKILVKKISCYLRLGKDIIGLIVLEGNIEDEDTCKKYAMIYERLDQYNGKSTRYLGRSREIMRTGQADFIDRGRFFRVFLGINEGGKGSYLFFYISSNFDFIEIGVMELKSPRLMGYFNGFLVFRGMGFGKEEYLEIGLSFPYEEFIDEYGELI